MTSIWRPMPSKIFFLESKFDPSSSASASASYPLGSDSPVNMSIRDKFRRTQHKSAYSDGAAQTSDSSASSSASGAELSKQASRPTKSWGWSSRSSNKKKEHKKHHYTHPSQRPFTETNLRHQEMLSHFTMTFGRRSSSSGRSSFSGISPCTSRHNSIDASHVPAHHIWLDQDVLSTMEERRLQ